MFYVYVLKEIDSERFYFGSTKDLRSRLKSHNQGKNKSTKGTQWTLVYYEAYISDSTAREREQQLKHHGNAKRALLTRVKQSLNYTGFTQHLNSK